MPLIRLQTSAPIDEGVQAPLIKALSAAVAGALGKPESYMMVVLEPGTAMLLGADEAPAAFGEVRSVGTISGEQARAISAEVCGLLDQHLGLPAGRVYLNFAGVPGSMWGYNGATFG